MLAKHGMRKSSEGFAERFADRGLAGFSRRPKSDERGYDPSQPRDDAGRWSGGGDSMAPDRGDGSGAQGTSPSDKPAMPADKFSAYVRDHVSFKDKVAVEFTNGRKFVGKATSMSVDGSLVLMRGKFEGAKGRKTELQSVSSAITHKISIHGKDDGDQEEEPKPAVKPAKEERLPEVPEAKAGIPKIPKAYADRVSNTQDSAIERYAKQNGKTAEEVADEWQAATEEAVGNAKMYVAMPPDVLERVLIEGRYKSQFETNASYGGDVQIESRRDAEAYLLGVKRNIDDEHRPVYGYASGAVPNKVRYQESGNFNPLRGSTRPDGYADCHGSCRGYGSVTVEIHDSAKERATITFGDSLNRQDTVIPSPILSPSYRSLNSATWEGDEDGNYQIVGGPSPVVTERSVDAQSRKNGDDERTGDYAEVQIHGGLPISEFATVWFDKEPAGKIASLLEQRGIKWKLKK